MTSASSTSARSLFGDSKNMLSERVKLNINNMSSVIKQMQKSSKSHEIISQSVKALASQDSSIDHTENNLNQIKNICINFNQQLCDLKKNIFVIEEVKEHVQTMQR
ncbi:uncharacterized protein LOC126902129 [Daktulosphaira vitifoliae]|uniref:uncharacterized protein LOC126902129 n=1 Tax=Daktulosphaira vitifoliae TaxID=58002 RepID=UPI0021A98B31|nr:uncharacterized protein LOC126902129 [Daktulosphaira vitifoliae]